MPPDSKETELGSIDQETSLSACKNTRVVVVPIDQETSLSACKNTRVVRVPCRTWNCFLRAINRGVNISEVPGCHLLKQMSSQ